jgi:two-component system chemotaxis response regulator CheB
VTPTTAATLNALGENAVAAETATRPGETATRDIVVIGASAGGVETLRRLVGELPRTYNGAILVVVHVSAEARSELAAILSRAGALPAVRAVDGMPIKHGQIHIAPPNEHLLVERGRLRVVGGARQKPPRPPRAAMFRGAGGA